MGDRGDRRLPYDVNVFIRKAVVQMREQDRERPLFWEFGAERYLLAIAAAAAAQRQ